MNRPLIEMGQHCLDMVTITWTGDQESEKSEVATILRVSPNGGNLHLDAAIAPGTSISIHLREGQIVQAQVDNYEQDEFGAYVSFRTVEPWFPADFFPAFLLPEPVAAAPAAIPTQPVPPPLFLVV